MIEPVKIADSLVGPGHPCFVIAEAGVNHNGDINLAKKLIDAAVDAGANAVKFQTFKADKVVSDSAPKAEYQLETTSGSESQMEMLRSLELSIDDHHEIRNYCQANSILFLSTPFDEDSVDLLETLDVPAFKISSGEITNYPLLKHVASKQRPIILSTGMSYLGEVDEAVQVIKKAGDNQIILLHCVSNYPAYPQDANLRAMQTMATAFQVPIGYSDHTPGIEVSLAAVALGACVIEKHFTLDRNMPGPDHRASLEPDQLNNLVKGIRNVEVSLGNGYKQPTESEANTRSIARRSLIAACDIQAGTRLTDAMIAIKRPGTGLPPQAKSYLIGRKVQVDIAAGSMITLEMLL